MHDLTARIGIRPRCVSGLVVNKKVNRSRGTALGKGFFLDQHLASSDGIWLASQKAESPSSGVGPGPFERGVVTFGNSRVGGWVWRGELMFCIASSVSLGPSLTSAL